jgi:DNA-binding transcriptional MerR regulator
MDPDSGKLFYSISEVCSLTGLKPHVLRYWETAFPMLSPSKNQSGNRVYKSEDIVLVKLISRLLYEERYTIDGARQKIEEMGDPSRQMELKLDASIVSTALLQTIKQEITEIMSILDRDPMAVDKQEDTG